MTKRILPARNDVLMAFKVLSLAPGLSRAAARIGSILVDHFGRSTGVCEPGVTRLAKLSGYNKSTVKKATSDLCEAGWFDKQSHGGLYNTCSYQPNWAAFTKFDRENRERFDADSKARKNRSSRYKNSDLNGLKNQTQTNLKTNLINQSEDCALDTQTGQVPEVRDLSQSPTSTNNKDRKGLRREKTNTNVQRSILLPINGGRGTVRVNLVEPDRLPV